MFLDFVSCYGDVTCYIQWICQLNSKVMGGSHVVRMANTVGTTIYFNDYR